jgi:hypothetical protein
MMLIGYAVGLATGDRSDNDDMDAGGGIGLFFNTLAQAQTPIPKELEGWQSWVQYGQEFRRCPFLAGTDGLDESNRICAWPGRLNLELHQGGGHFTQTWISYAEGWVSLPGNLEYWPSAVTVNGTAAAAARQSRHANCRAWSIRI